MVSRPVAQLHVRGFKQKKVHLANWPKHIKKSNTWKMNYEVLSITL